MLSGEPFGAETHRAAKDPGKPAGRGNGVWQDRKTRKLVGEDAESKRSGGQFRPGHVSPFPLWLSFEA